MAARVALEQAREQVAALLGARSREVVFTSGATESIAAAVFGAADRAAAKGQVDADGPHAPGGHGGRALGRALRRRAVGRGDRRPGRPARAGRSPTRCSTPSAPRPPPCTCSGATTRWAPIQPVAEVVAACRERGVLVHVDAAQAVGRVPIAFDDLGADLLSMSGHKLGGPAGTGALLVRRGLRIAPLLLGGDQERARRAGLEPVAALVGLGRRGRRRAHRPLDGEAADAVAADRPGPGRRRRHRRRRGLRRSRPPPPPPGVPRHRGHRAPGRAARPRPGRRSPPTPAAPAPPSRWSRRRCWRRWASTPTGPCASRWAGRPPTPTSTRLLAALPVTIDRLRALGTGAADATG